MNEPARVDSGHLTQLLDYQHSLLGHAMSTSSRDEILSRACMLAESAVDGSLSSVMAVQDDGRLEVISAPSIPGEAISALNGTPVLVGHGSCATTVARRKPTFVCDTLSDEAWTHARGFAEKFGIHACWSYPVVDSDGNVVASFALSSTECRTPTSFQRRILEISAHVIGMVLVRDQQESTIRYLAMHDETTGLPNRRLMVSELERRCEQTRQGDSRFGVLYVDLDRFKQINDSFGHRIGDQVIKETAHRLERLVAGECLLARMGGDEFIVLVDDVTDVTQLERMAARIASAFVEPLHIDGIDHQLMMSIGIAVGGRDAQDAEKLLQCADAAMYHAKHCGRNQYRVFHPQYLDQSRLMLEISNGIHRALAGDEFQLAFQPRFRVSDLAMIGAEALIRWQRSDGVLLAPGHFIPQAEELGLVDRITRWVFEHALVQHRKWIDLGYPAFSLSINLSGRDLNSAQIDAISAIVRNSGVVPELVEVEITESWLLGDESEDLRQVRRLRDMGLRVAVDDFGVGQSSLSRLKRLPVTTLKIDRSLVSDLPGDAHDRVVISSIIDMSKGLDLETVAEGVEHRSQLDFLATTGCHQVQGFYLAKPMRPSAISEQLQPAADSAA